MTWLRKIAKKLHAFANIDTKKMRRPVWLVVLLFLGKLGYDYYSRPATAGAVIPKSPEVQAVCAKGYNGAYKIAFTDHALIDFDRGRLLDWNEYLQTDEYKEQQQHRSTDPGQKTEGKNLLPDYELALTYRQDDQLLRGHKGFPFILRRKGIAISKLLYDELGKVDVSILKEALKGKADGPSPLDDGIWAIRTSEGSLVALEIRGLPPSSSYPHAPREYNPMLYACLYSNSWF